MSYRWQRTWFSPGILALLGAAYAATAWEAVSAQEQSLPSHPATLVPCEPPAPLRLPGPCNDDKPLPINLPTALSLAGVRPLDIALASERVRVAAAQLQRANALWLPTIYLGVDYYRHDGQLQDVAGNVFGTSKDGFMVGCGPSAVFAISDAIFAPLAARQHVRARQALVQSAQNDSLLAVAEAYFNVQQARGELAGADDAARKADDLVRTAEKLAPGLIPKVEVLRTRTEAAHRRQAVESARERWRSASAELARVLRLEPSALIVPLEPPHLRVSLVPPNESVDDLIPMGLTSRPELAAQQALVQATLQRLRQEKLRPLIPSVLLRGFSTPVTGTLGAGLFGGGLNGQMSNFDFRSDLDLQLVWQFESLGVGNHARVDERRAENRLAVLELFKTQDRIAAEVTQAHAQVRSAVARLSEAEVEVKAAVESANENIKGLQDTKGDNKLLTLLVRPQEAVAAVQALAQAYVAYYGAVADYDRAQFRLYHALGQPAQLLTCQPPADPVPQADGAAPAAPVRLGTPAAVH
jgi:outer membrane protein TolC